MGKYLKKIESGKITGVYSKEQTAIMNHYKDQPNNGTTLISFENPNTKVSRTVFVDNHNSFFEYDEETDFHWEFGYNNGHPCVFITFYGISQTLRDNGILCLETNTQIKGKRNKTINVYSKSEDGLRFSLQNITWFFCSDLELNTQYCIYIKGKKPNIIYGSPDNMRGLIGPWRIASRNFPNIKIPNDYIITLNIRPTFRMDTSEKDLYTNYKAKAEYINISYYLKQEI